MKALPVAIALSLLGSVLPLMPALARPLESDLLCYMQTPSGRVINLESLCESTSVAVPTSVVEQIPIQNSRVTSQRRPGDDGRIMLINSRVAQRQPYLWVISGTVQNQSDSIAKGINLTLRFATGETQQVNVDQTLNPKESGTFSTLYSGRREPKNLEFISSAWYREDGSEAKYP